MTHLIIDVKVMVTNNLQTDLDIANGACIIIVAVTSFFWKKKFSHLKIFTGMGPPATVTWLQFPTSQLAEC